MDCRLPHPSPPPGVCSNSCPLSWWCHRTISSSAAVYSFCLSLSQHQGLFQWVSSSYQVAHLPKGTLKGKEGKRARVEPSWLILGSQCCLQNSVAKKKKDFSSYLLPIPFDYLSRAMSSKGKSQQESHRHTSTILGTHWFWCYTNGRIFKNFL